MSVVLFVFSDGSSTFALRLRCARQHCSSGTREAYSVNYSRRFCDI